VTGVFQGMLLFYLLAADLFIRFRLRWVTRVRAEPQRVAVTETA
jgi:simple sugar transport system permease protein